MGKYGKFWYAKMVVMMVLILAGLVYASIVYCIDLF